MAQAHNVFLDFEQVLLFALVNVLLGLLSQQVPLVLVLFVILSHCDGVVYFVKVIVIIVVGTFGSFQSFLIQFHLLSFTRFQAVQR